MVDGDLKDRLGSLAVYAKPADLRATIKRFVGGRQSVTRVALSKAQELILRNLRDRAVAVIEALVKETPSRIAIPRALRPPAGTSVAHPEVLFISSNGVGLGHLTRLMAVARRLKHAHPIFLTMS